MLSECYIKSQGMSIVPLLKMKNKCISDECSGNENQMKIKKNSDIIIFHPKAAENEKVQNMSFPAKTN